MGKGSDQILFNIKEDNSMLCLLGSIPYYNITHPLQRSSKFHMTLSDNSSFVRIEKDFDFFAGFNLPCCRPKWKVYYGNEEKMLGWINNDWICLKDCCNLPFSIFKGDDDKALMTLKCPIQLGCFFN